MPLYLRRLFPGSGRQVGQVYSTSRTTDFWRDFPVDQLAVQDRLTGFAPIDTVGEALPHNYMGLNVDVVVQDQQLTGTWSRSIKPLAQTITRQGNLTGNFDENNRFANTPWLSYQPKTPFKKLHPGETCYVIQLVYCFLSNRQQGALISISVSSTIVTVLLPPVAQPFGLHKAGMKSTPAISR